MPRGEGAALVKGNGFTTHEWPNPKFFCHKQDEMAEGSKHAGQGSARAALRCNKASMRDFY